MRRSFPLLILLVSVLMSFGAAQLVVLNTPANGSYAAYLFRLPSAFAAHAGAIFYLFRFSSVQIAAKLPQYLSKSFLRV
jgi:hypothetical protein